MSADELTQSERVELMRFLCSFAWADGEIQPQEMTVLQRVRDGLGLSPQAHAQVDAWLSTAPDVEGRALHAISEHKREAFIDRAYEVAAADGAIAAQELRHLQMFMRFTYGDASD